MLVTYYWCYFFSLFGRLFYLIPLKLQNSKSTRIIQCSINGRFAHYPFFVLIDLINHLRKSEEHLDTENTVKITDDIIDSLRPFCFSFVIGILQAWISFDFLCIALRNILSLWKIFLLVIHLMGSIAGDGLSSWFYYKFLHLKVGDSFALILLLPDLFPSQKRKNLPPFRLRVDRKCGSIKFLLQVYLIERFLLLYHI